MSTIVHRGINLDNLYRGIPIHAAWGLHEACLKLIKDHIPCGGKVLDLAAGSGAFTQRLLDAGYEVAASELDPSSWMVPKVPIWSLDLNLPLPEESPSHAFDVVVAMEVIEHLRDPQLLLEHCRAFCREGGFILITTPNVMSPISYFRYLKNGRFEYFDEFLYESTGHSTPLPYWLFEKHCGKAGLEVVLRCSAGQSRSRLAQWKVKVKDILRRAIQLILRGGTPREIAMGTFICYLLRRRK